ncbi:hypothetical protein CO659_00190 [Rhizobium sp. S9]|uniref:hypothetical protein n=1 Tax=Rhizobium sp. S9 TaxID=2035454 RepID=UPI000BE887D7|nr:hypothetical protein [Rhizobium sp. S9]PDS99272.1 hypothetical protein CO659_00190 [Rhizobium sp. S9]
MSGRWHFIFPLIAAALCGTAFGFAQEESQVVRPDAKVGPEFDTQSFGGSAYVPDLPSNFGGGQTISDSTDPVSVVVDRPHIVPGEGLKKYYATDLSVKVSVKEKTEEALKALCETMAYGTGTGFSDNDRPVVGFVRTLNKDEPQPCAMTDLTSDNLARATTIFADKKIIKWNVGTYGYVVFANRLFPDRNREFLPALPVDRMKNTLLLLTNNYTIRKKLPTDEVIVVPRQDVCDCANPPGSAQAIAALSRGDFECIKRDEAQRACPGKKHTIQEQRQPRPYFLPAALDDDYLRFADIGMSSEEAYTKNNNTYLWNWCEFDHYFPCDLIKAYVLGDQTDANNLSEYFLRKFCPDCHGDPSKSGHLTPLVNDQWFHERLSVDASRNDAYSSSEIKDANEAIQKVTDEAGLAFLFVPVEFLRSKELSFKGLAIIGVTSDESQSASPIDNRFLVEGISIYVTPSLFGRQLSRSYMSSFVFAPRSSSRTSACNTSDIPCYANLKEGETRTILWSTPIQH